MTMTFKRRLYRLSLVSATLLLLGALAYALADVGIYSLQLFWFCYLFTFAGIVSCMKTMETWSSWLEDTSEDSDETTLRSNIYPLAFNLEAFAILLVAAFLFVWTVGRSPTSQEGLIFIWCIIVAIGCALTGRLAAGLE
ncbi:MAG TPA: hypothetical protein VFQ30_03960 [Ktedonobacteraceae bacterium]|nr:hypothetical protein [Ktedonobacteraceae bacterium]